MEDVGKIISDENKREAIYDEIEKSKSMYEWARIVALIGGKIEKNKTKSPKFDTIRTDYGMDRF